MHEGKIAMRELEEEKQVKKVTALAILFSLHFEHCYKEMSLTVDPNTSVADLLKQAVATTQADKIFQRVNLVEVCRTNHPGTKHFSLLCKRALAIVIGEQEQTS